MQVYGYGPVDCQLALIGEAPGRDEVRIGRPFVGLAGQHLDKILSQLGIVRALLYVTNVVKENPKGNEIKHFIEITSRGVKPTKAYFDYEARLYEELQFVNANCLVALGATALFALTRKVGIMNWRGSILEGVPAIGGRKVVAAIHPSAALREPLYTHLIRHDLQRAKEQAEFPEIRRVHRDIRIAPSFTEVLYYLSEMPRIVGFDIENPVRHVICFSFAKSPTDAMSIPLVYNRERDYFTPEQEMEVMRATAKVLENPEILKVGHNIKHDAYIMFRDYGIVTHPVADTMIGCKLILPDYPKRLAFATSIFTEIPYYKYMGGKQGGLAEGYDK